MTDNTNLLDLSDIHGLAEAEGLEDQSKAVGGGDFKRELLPVKKHPVRLVGYVELGQHEQTAAQEKAYGKKDPSDQVHLTFEVLSKDALRKNDKDEIVGARRLSFTIKKSMHEKAGYRKLFDRMRAGDTTITHMTQMIGSHSWLLSITWEQNRQALTSKDAREKAQAALEADPSNKDLKIWENYKENGVMALSPAVRPVLDEDGEETGEVNPMNIRPVIGEYKVFIWDKPIVEYWQSIFIEGEWENKDKDGNVTKKSKNYLQEMAMAAVNFDGSALQGMLDGLDESLGDTGTAEKDGADEEAAKKEAAKKKAAAKEAAKKEKVEEPDTSDEDEFDEMGL